MAIEGVDTENTEAAPVPEGWGEQTPEDDISYGRMLRFILPTLGIWLASPIMSLVDAGVVGECSKGSRTAANKLFSGTLFRSCHRCSFGTQYILSMYLYITVTPSLASIRSAFVHSGEVNNCIIAVRLRR